MTLTTPARLSPHANAGLFTAVARAGDSLVAVGEQGRIMRSTDDGVSWNQLEVPTSVTLTGVEFVDAMDGWVIGQMGVVLKTSDGGKNWTRVLDGVTANNLLVKAAQSDLKSAPGDASATANLQAAQQFVVGGPSVPFLALQALSSLDVVVAGGFGMAFESQDGGKSWQSIFDAIPNPNGLNIYHLLATRAATYFIGEQGFLAARNPTGEYTALPAPVQGTLFGGLVTPAGTVLLYGLQGAVMRSTDTGAHWTSSASGTQAGIDAGIVCRNGTIILGDLSGDLLISKDDGTSFISYKTDEPVTGLVEAANGAVIASGPRGIRRVPYILLGA